MGRKRKNAVHSFFSFEQSTNTSKCNISGCSAEIKGRHATNLVYHLSSKHKDEYDIVKRRNDLANLSTTDEDENGASTSTSTHIVKISERSRSKAEKIKQECIKLVTVHGRPFALVDDGAFKKILSFSGISTRELQALNSHNIRNSIQAAANEKRGQIARQIKDKMVCIKVDGATCQDRMFLGINAQYILNDKIVVIHLGVTELHARSSSEYLKEVLLRVMRKYNLTVDQIYSITIDNGSNMIKMTRLINEQITLQSSDDNDETDESDHEEEDSHRIDQIEITLQAENSQSDDNRHSVTTVRCAAHTLQLAVMDALKENEVEPIIEEARRLARKLRTPTIKNILKTANKRKAILDCSTRWNSTLTMLERLLELRDFCSDRPDHPLYMNDVTWKAVSDLKESLFPAKVLTKQLQSEQLTIGDFFGFWTHCYITTSKVMVPLAQQICRSMEIRKQQLMNNKAFVCALFLDPRFQVVLSAEETASAVSHIQKTWLQILKIKSSAINVDEEPHPQSPEDQLEETDEIEELLANTEHLRRQNSRTQYVNTQCNIVSLLENFSKHPRINHKENILQFWHKKKASDPQLYQLASTILATPATQVSVERLFSSLKFILSSLRYNLTDEIVEDILVLRNNG